jgi:protein SERAC1
VHTDERDHATIAALHKATYSILFFKTPHKGLVINDIKHMVVGDNNYLRTKLLRQVKVKFNLLMH